MKNSASPLNYPAARGHPAYAYDNVTNKLYIYGGIPCKRKDSCADGNGNFILSTGKRQRNRRRVRNIFAAKSFCSRKRNDKKPREKPIIVECLQRYSVRPPVSQFSFSVVNNFHLPPNLPLSFFSVGLQTKQAQSSAICGSSVTSVLLSLLLPLQLHLLPQQLHLQLHRVSVQRRLQQD